MTLESEFFRAYKANTKHLAEWTRIENLASSGVFDNVMHHKTTMAWVEFKVNRSNDEKGWLKPSQKVWGRKMLRWCPNLFVVVLYQQAEAIWTYRLEQQSMLQRDQNLLQVAIGRAKYGNSFGQIIMHAIPWVRTGQVG